MPQIATIIRSQNRLPEETQGASWCIGCFAFAFPLVAELCFAGQIGTHNLTKRWWWSGNPDIYRTTELQQFFRNGAMALAAVFFVILFEILGFRGLANWLRSTGKNVAVRYNFTRSRILITIAVCMFVVATLI